jgi:hypothetical protein
MPAALRIEWQVPVGTSLTTMIIDSDEPRPAGLAVEAH